jgi:glycosyltransferase involved in cell wall biosynthesis
MKILHINTATTGGAATAALRIHQGMVNQGLDSHFLSLSQADKFITNHHVYNGPIKKIKPDYPVLSFKNWLKEKLFLTYSSSLDTFNKKQKEKTKFTSMKIINGFNTFSLFSYPETPYDITETQIYQDADVIHLHWVAEFLDYSTFLKKNKKPIVWTMHDMNPIMGGFHYKNDLLDNLETHEIEDKLLEEIKIAAYRNASSLTIVAPSKWLCKAAKESEAFKTREVVNIRYRIDRTIFRPRDKQFARSLFQLPTTKKIFLLASKDLNDPRKGIDLVLPIIEHKEMQDCIFLLAGSNFKGKSYPNVVALGGIQDELLMSLAYNASDYFILSSREDNLPNTMLESIACGTPIIGFNIGDNPEIIGENNCGIICDDLTTESLLIAFKSVLNDEIKFETDLISEIAKELFSEEKIVKEYKTVYEKIVLQD